MAKSLKIILPQATLAFAWLAKPDEVGKYSDGKYKTTICIPKEGIHEDMPQVRMKADGEWGTYPLDEVINMAAAEEWGKAPKKIAYSLRCGDEYAEEKDKPEFAGHWMINAKSKYQPKTFDANRTEVDVAASSGDEARVSVTLFAYGEGAKRGVSFQMSSVQIIKKNAGGAGSADDFDEEDFGDDAYTKAEATAADEEYGDGGDDNY